MEEKRIKLPTKYSLIKGRSLSNREKYFKELTKTEKTKSDKSINENNLKTSASESTFFTNKKKNKSINFIYKKNISRPKGKLFLARNSSSKKRDSTIFKNIFNPNPNYPKYNEKINLIDNSYKLFNNKNNIICYNNIKKKIHGNKEIQDKIKIHTIKNTNNISIINNNNLKKNTNYCFNSANNNNYFINIEDLMLLDEKFNDVLKSIKLQSNIANECFEFINFYVQSSLFNKFENYFRDKNSKIIAQNSLILIIFDIMLIYHLSFDQACINSNSNYLKKIIEMNYNSYLLLCNYISNKVSSKEKGNIWVKKLKIMIKENLTHLSLNNEEYINYLFSNNFNMNNEIEEKFTKSFNELKFYIYMIEKYLKILFKFLDDNQYLKTEFIEIFQNLQNTSIEQLNNIFFSKILRVKNKDASVGGGIFLYNYDGDKEQKEEKVPYINYPLLKKFSLILDLDETLISFQMDEKTKNKGILKFRPGLDEFLQNIKKYYEIIVFTSATKEYADSIEDEIENDIKYFDYRLYRQHTIIYDNYLVKDISRIGRELDKMIIVDNMPQNYKLQKENGIMIKPYWGEDDYDTALISLQEILIKIAINFDDVRKGILFYKDDILNKVSSNFSRKENNLLNNIDNYK